MRGPWHDAVLSRVLLQLFLRGALPEAYHDKGCEEGVAL